jgi:hypothetical protein
MPAMKSFTMTLEIIKTHCAHRKLQMLIAYSTVRWICQQESVKLSSYFVMCLLKELLETSILYFFKTG